MNNDQVAVLTAAILIIGIVIFFVAWSGAVARARRTFRTDLPVRYFRPSGCDHPPHLGEFQGRGAMGRWSRGIVRDFLAINPKIDWNSDLVQTAIERLQAGRGVELHLLAMRPFVVTNYEKAIERFKQYGLAYNKTRSGVLLFVNLDAREFTLLVDTGLLPHLDENSLNDWARFLADDFGKENYSGGVVRLIERLEVT